MTSTPPSVALPVSIQAARTLRIQVYLPQWLADKFFEYLRKHNLSQAEGGRRAIAAFIRNALPSGEELFERVEARLVATLERDGGELRDKIGEIRQMLAEIRGLLREIAGRQ